MIAYTVAGTDAFLTELMCRLAAYTADIPVRRLGNLIRAHLADPAAAYEEIVRRVREEGGEPMKSLPVLARACSCGPAQWPRSPSFWHAAVGAWTAAGALGPAVGAQEPPPPLLPDDDGDDEEEEELDLAALLGDGRPKPHIATLASNFDVLQRFQPELAALLGAQPVCRRPPHARGGGGRGGSRPID